MAKKFNVGDYAWTYTHNWCVHFGVITSEYKFKDVTCYWFAPEKKEWANIFGKQPIHPTHLYHNTLHGFDELIEHMKDEKNLLEGSILKIQEKRKDLENDTITRKAKK